MEEQVLLRSSPEADMGMWMSFTRPLPAHEEAGLSCHVPMEHVHQNLETRGRSGGLAFLKTRSCGSDLFRFLPFPEAGQAGLKVMLSPESGNCPADVHVEHARFSGRNS